MADDNCVITTMKKRKQTVMNCVASPIHGTLKNNDKNQ